MSALGPQDREIQWAQRESAKQEFTDLGVLPRPSVIAYSIETKGANGSNKKGLPVRPWTQGPQARIGQELRSLDVLLCSFVAVYPPIIEKDQRGTINCLPVRYWT